MRNWKRLGSLRACELREGHVVARAGLRLFLFEAPLVIDVVLGVHAKLGRARKLVHRIEVLVQGLLRFVVVRRWRLELRHGEPVS